MPTRHHGVTKQWTWITKAWNFSVYWSAKVCKSRKEAAVMPIQYSKISDTEFPEMILDTESWLWNALRKQQQHQGFVAEAGCLTFSVCILKKDIVSLQLLTHHWKGNLFKFTRPHTREWMNFSFGADYIVRGKIPKDFVRSCFVL